METVTAALSAASEIDDMTATIALPRLDWLSRLRSIMVLRPGQRVVNVDETITDDLAPGTYYYDVQTLITSAVATPDSGTFEVTADVTRSVA